MPVALVLGSGLVGSVIAADLAAGPDASADLEVVVADRDPERLAVAARRAAGGPGRVRTETCDLADPAAITRLAREADVVLGALPSRLGFAGLRAVLESGRPFSDISFFIEDALELDAVAREHGATAVFDMGVAPGLTNLLAGWGVQRLDRCDAIEMLVGGVPVVRHRPFEYKAGFAPADVLEEYVRPARVVEGGRLLERPALGRIEPVEFDGVGTLEAFDTDGLRSLATTLDVPDMCERTLRWPGHARLMAAFRDAGFLDETPTDVRGTSVVPRDLTAALLFPRWTYEEGEPDCTVLRVDARGELDGRPTTLRWELVDRLDPATGFSSMSRTTAFPCTIVARMLLAGRIEGPGVLAPEMLVRDAALAGDLLDALRVRGVEVRERTID